MTAADPTGATYQWRKNGVNLTAGPAYTGVNASTLTINTVALGDAGNYDVIVSNSCGTDTSSAAALTVNTPPTVSCPATSLLFVPDPGQCGQNVSYSATATGTPTSTLSYSPAPGSYYPVGSYSATATATNACGSANCQISFKVAEDIDPVVQKCVDPITQCDPQVFWTAPLFTDNCGIQTIVSTHTPTSTFPLGTTQVTYTAYDSSGNSVSCSFDVTITAPPLWYIDADSDSYGSTASSQVSCTQPSGYADNSGDCDDNNAAINPAATEICDNIDNDCDGSADDGLTFVDYYTDADGDTYGTGAAQSLCSNPGAGFATQAGDCDDNNAAINPAATEICDNIDNDCDGAVDSADPNFVDTTAPVAPSIANATGECSVTVTAPTATDNCAGSVTGTTADPLSYSAQGTYTITWTFDDGNGNSSTATQNVIVDDVTAPVAPSIADATGECSVTVTAPTATDNCAGTITGSTRDPLTYSAQGTYTITWEFNDGNGNTSTAIQNVIVDDVTAPVAPTLANATGECSVTVTAVPTATDNCAGTITGSTRDPLTYTTQGTYTLTWEFNDGNGNTSTATQTVIVDDVTAPLAPAIADATGECSVTVTAPTTTDNCVGSVTGTTADPLTYSAQGTYTITWSFNDGNGNTSTATQTVIVDDVTAPAAPTIADATGECSVTVTAPTATDNCTGSVTGTTADPLSYSTQGTYTITWTFNDGNGNSSTATQTVIVDDMTAPVAACKNATIYLNAAGQASLSVANIDNGSSDNCGISSSSLSQTSYNCAHLGSNSVSLQVTDVGGNTHSCTATVSVLDTIRPTIASIGTITATYDPALCGATVSYGPVSYSDNCGASLVQTA
ncbi:MAG: HYR domain-containing protein, partial [Bacteroidota bacterium]